MPVALSVYLSLILRACESKMFSDNHEEALGMKIGICLPNNWGVEDVQSIFQIATRAEELGFNSVWVSEHVL